jgi:hypothetical protein
VDEDLAKDMVQKTGKLLQFKSHEWFTKHWVEIALLARALIPPQAYLTQVLLLVVSECSNCPLGSCQLKCESSKPPGRFRIVRAWIEVRPIPRANLSKAIEALLNRPSAACLDERGRLVMMTDKNDKSVTQFCFTDNCEEESTHRYTATQLLGVINRDEKYAVPEMRRQLMASRTLLPFILHPLP